MPFLEFPLLIEGSSRKILRRTCPICPDISCFPPLFVLESRVDKKWRLKMPKHVTMRSLADELGLAESAVSRALSGKKGVSEQTRRRSSPPRAGADMWSRWFPRLCPCR